MIVENTKIQDVKILIPKIFKDKRGFFFESFNLQEFNKELKIDVKFVQDNHSKSLKGVLRGMHYQNPPFSQGKLVRVISGEIYDVALDLRQNSPTYGNWVGEYLSSENQKQLWIPEGFAHGFLTLSDTAEVIYKTTNYYSRSHEETVLYNDNRFKIDWPILDKKLILSDKDSV